MSFAHILLRSLRSHRLSAGLAVVATAMGVALVLTVTSLREQSARHFATQGLGVDAVLGPKGSPLQIALNALFHLDEMPGTLRWREYLRLRENDVVADAFPFTTGHSYAGFRVNGVEPRFLTDFEYQPGRRFALREGRPFARGGEAVAGAEAARLLGLRVGGTFAPTHGVRSGDPVHADDVTTFVGILAPTGSPHDRAIYVPLESFYGMEGHGEAVERMAQDLDAREISGAYVKVRRIRGGALHPGIQQLKYEANRGAGQLVVPNEVLPQLFRLIGWADRVLLLLGGLVTALGLAILFVVLVTTLRQQRRTFALLRMLGATRRVVVGLILGEAVLLSLAGAAAGMALAYGLTTYGAFAVARETGILFSPTYLSSAHYWVLPTLALLGAVGGLIPAAEAYRLSVLRNLRAAE
jgi:putative ABC transport system permease protein